MCLFYDKWHLQQTSTSFYCVFFYRSPKRPFAPADRNTRGQNTRKRYTVGNHSTCYMGGQVKELHEEMCGKGKEITSKGTESCISLVVLSIENTIGCTVVY